MHRFSLLFYQKYNNYCYFVQINIFIPASALLEWRLGRRLATYCEIIIDEFCSFILHDLLLYKGGELVNDYRHGDSYGRCPPAVCIVLALSSSSVYDKDILARCLAVNYLSMLPLLALPDSLCRRWTLFGRDNHNGRNGSCLTWLASS